jgi:hypothetical protein
MCLNDGNVVIDQERYYLDNLGRILGVFQAIIAQSITAPVAATVS